MKFNFGIDDSPTKAQLYRIKRLQELLDRVPEGHYAPMIHEKMTRKEASEKIDLLATKLKKRYGMKF